MPLYTYLHPETQELIDVVQGMKDVHVHVDSKGVEWKRVYTPTNFSVDGNLNSISSSKDFVEKTRNKNYSHGDLCDIAKEASEKREKQMGKDPVKQKWFKEYSEQRKGRKHPNDPSGYTS